MATAGMRPSSVALEGQFQVFDGEEGQIDNARRIEHPDGLVSFIIDYAGVDERWELRVEGRSSFRIILNPISAIDSGD